MTAKVAMAREILGKAIRGLEEAMMAHTVFGRSYTMGRAEMKIKGAQAGRGAGAGWPAQGEEERRRDVYRL